MYAICNLRLVIQRLELNEAINEMLETIPNTDLTFPSLNAPDVVTFVNLQFNKWCTFFNISCVGMQNGGLSRNGPVTLTGLTDTPDIPCNNC